MEKRCCLDATTGNLSRIGRPLNLSARAREAVNDHCPMEADPVISHFRKRKLTESPLSTREQKIAKCKAVTLVSQFSLGDNAIEPWLKPDHVSELAGSVYVRPDNGTKFLVSRRVVVCGFGLFLTQVEA